MMLFLGGYDSEDDLIQIETIDDIRWNSNR